MLPVLGQERKVEICYGTWTNAVAKSRSDQCAADGAYIKLRV